MEWARLNKRNHYEHITEQLRLLIVEGRLKTGDKLPSTKELSEQFGVSRSTTREALSALKAMGLIDIRQGGYSTVLGVPPPFAGSGEGVFANLRMNRETILELLEARKAFEISNAGLAARKREAPDLEQFRQLLARMEAGRGDEQVGEQTDIAFHRLLAESTHNSIMLTLFDAVSSQMALAIRETRRAELYANRSVSDRLYQEHAAIFESVELGDAKSAEERMRVHLRHVESILMRYLR